jgi:hypothetical protein
VEEDHDSMVSVSTAFFPRASIFAAEKADLVLLSSDLVFFYAHSSRLRTESTNKFNSFLDTVQSNVDHIDHLEHGFTVVPVTESSEVVNIVLHTVYNMPFAHYSPQSNILMLAIHALDKYGISVKRYTAPHMPLYELLLRHAPTNPLQFYVLAGRYDLYDLAVPISSMLLANSLTEAGVDEIGPVYLARLIRLRCMRIDALKRLLLQPPRSHPPMWNCSLEDQTRLTRAWLLTSAYFVLEARPGTHFLSYLDITLIMTLLSG